MKAFLLSLLLAAAPPAPFVLPLSNGLYILIDESARPRRVMTSQQQAAADLKAWSTGRDIYTSLCSRCHGADGSDRSYAGGNVKPVNRLGHRYSEAELLERTESTGTVDLSNLDARLRHALAVYVLSL
ncbi:hypothetical protein [uncultured Paludibaculum sp.]|uniref:c-type cytochrome n=1 Tax=uncultured Paludibaculum sp. TaxID=1765020 RepID=UPI002AABB23D|nr:hypothetical protein [uncultured Paludibaculum sp.]